MKTLIQGFIKTKIGRFTVVSGLHPSKPKPHHATHWIETTDADGYDNQPIRSSCGNIVTYIDRTSAELAARCKHRVDAMSKSPHWEDSADWTRRNGDKS